MWRLILTKLLLAVLLSDPFSAYFCGVILGLSSFPILASCRGQTAPSEWQVPADQQQQSQQRSRQVNPYVRTAASASDAASGPATNRVLTPGSLQLRPMGSVFPQQQEPAEPGIEKNALQQEVTVADIESLEQQLSKEGELEQTIRDSVAKLLSDAKVDLQTIANSKTKTAGYLQDIQNAQDKANRLEQQIKQFEPTQIEKGMDSAEINQQLTLIDQAISERQRQLQELANEPQRRESRTIEIVKLLPTVKSDLTQAIDALTKRTEPEGSLQARAERLALQVKQQLLSAEIRELESERNKYEIEQTVKPRSLIELNAELDRKQLDDQIAAKTEYESERKIAEEREQRALDAQAAESRRNRLVADNRVLRQYSAEFEAWGDQRTDLTASQEEADKLLAEAEAMFQELEREFRNSRIRVEDIGLISLVGQRLRSEKARMANMRALRVSAGGNSLRAEQVQSELFDLREQKRNLESRKSLLIRQALAEAPEFETEADKAEFQSAANALFDDQIQLLSESIDDHSVYVRTLTNLYSTERRTLALSREYLDYINERILWIRSNNLLFEQWQIDSADRAILSLGNWREFVSQCSNDFRRRPWYYLFSLGLGITLMLMKNGFRKRIGELGEQAMRGTCTEFRVTARALLLTVLMAAGIPIIGSTLGLNLVMMDLGNLEEVQPEASSLVRAMGWALLTATWVYFPMELLRYVCRSRGLAESHFGWQASSIAVIRTNLKWSTAAAAIFSFCIALLLAFNRKHDVDLVERTLFVASMLALTLLFSRIFHPDHGVFKEALAAQPDSWMTQTRRLWYSGILLVPMFLALLAFVGYYYTATILVMRVYAMLVMVFAVVLTKDLFLRFILLRRREFHIQQARERRSEQAEPTEASGTAAELMGIEQDRISAEQLAVDVGVNVQHSRKLIGVFAFALACIGAWWIWVDVLPAVKMLDQYQIWPVEVAAASTPATQESGDQAETQPGSADTDASNPRAASSAAGSEAAAGVTYRDLLLAILIGLVTLVAARNLPGLLEMLFLKQLPVDQSIRHAFKAIVSYVIILVGTVTAFRTLKIGWGQVQWLATALTFGLAFGLQEIFANFVAGIILLLERPLRIGDVVTVDDVTGVVSRIRTRATTITNWDRQEYVIPNKEFITGRMLNWTLSDKVNRVVIHIGIAYGADVEKAKQLLRKACEDQPVILNDPAPLITFESFDDSCLTLVLRAYLPDLDNRLSVVDQLHSQINQDFAAAGIEIPFPQRDIHVRSDSTGRLSSGDSAMVPAAKSGDKAA